jgi:peptidoglycan/LPS O-acetylase OafA/YrhL
MTGLRERLESTDPPLSAVPTSEPVRAMGGLDLLRLGAVMLVTTQHVLSLTDHELWMTFRSLNAGQLGVAIFLGVSALLGSKSHRRPVPWLAQRLRRIYPAYWLAMIFSFTLVWLTGYKTFSAGQFVSQMLGTGLFTHPHSLVNVPTWFVSLLLVCYIGLFFGRLTRHPLLVDLALVAALLSWGTSKALPWPWFHLLTFFATSALALAVPANHRMTGFIAAGLLLLPLSPLSVVFAYTGLSLLLIGASAGISAIPRAVGKIAEYSYEYYLLHGVFLLGAVTALRNHPVIAAACGVSLAFLSAILLHRVVDHAMRWSAPPPRESPHAMDPPTSGHKADSPEYRDR